MVQKISAVIIVLLLLASCDKTYKCEDKPVYQHSFVRGFILPPKAGDNGEAGSNINSFIVPATWNSRVEVGSTCFGFDKSKSLHGEDNDSFTSMAKSYGDWGYDRKVFFWDGGHIVLGENVLGIKLICLQDFDDNHKAMSCLNDIADMEWYSPQQYINAKYQWTDSNIGNGWDHFFNSWYAIFPSELENMKYHGNLDDASIFPISMFGEYFCIRFKSEPKEKGDYRIRIQMELESGVQTSEFVQKW